MNPEGERIPDIYKYWNDPDSINYGGIDLPETIKGWVNRGLKEVTINNLKVAGICFPEEIQSLIELGVIEKQSEGVFLLTETAFRVAEIVEEADNVCMTILVDLKDTYDVVLESDVKPTGRKITKKFLEYEQDGNIDFDNE